MVKCQLNLIKTVRVIHTDKIQGDNKAAFKHIFFQNGKLEKRA